MTWLDSLLTEDQGTVDPLLVVVVPLLGADGQAGSVFDPTLEALCSGLPMEDARALREERAGILEHEAGFTRDQAERKAGL